MKSQHLVGCNSHILCHAFYNDSCTLFALALNHLPDLVFARSSCTMSRLLVWLYWHITAGQHRALGQDSGMADASEDNGENDNSAGEDSDMGDDAEEGKLLTSTCCAFVPQLCDLHSHDLIALALSQLRRIPMKAGSPNPTCWWPSLAPARKPLRMLPGHQAGAPWASTTVW